MSDDTPPPALPWPSVAHSRHATPAPDFTTLPSHFTPAEELPHFMARIGGNDMDDGPAPSDRTPSKEPDPNMAATHLITNCVRNEVDTRLNPITRQLNALTDLVQRLSDQMFAPPPVTTAAPPKAVPKPARKPPQNHTPPKPPVPMVRPDPQAL
jgi:hypothetical protein